MNTPSSKNSKPSPYNPTIVAKNELGVDAKTGGAMTTCYVGLKRPMPCIVILVHGVNDVGEAYQNQESGMIAGLNQRLGRDDLYPHEWKDYALEEETPQMRVCGPGRSPVIPFYWGYKPVDHATWEADQREYRAAMKKSKNSAETPLPYDAYQENNPDKLKQYGNDNNSRFANDCFGNVLDSTAAKGGGTFANATTSLPDMLGPGAGGMVMATIGFMSRTNWINEGDFTHPIYENPHRIYQFFAAQRLADLILTIRQNKPTEHDTINIVAHSQGTLITMLANMLVKQEGADPADCVILNHSPYALANTVLEGVQDGHHQTDKARQETFKHFCQLMATNPHASADGQHSAADTQRLKDRVCLPRESHWDTDPRYSRNNFGKVYNYFCPNDGTVSLRSVQGFGWRGIPDAIANSIPNLRQRVFYQNYPVGGAPASTPFRKPPAGSDDYAYSAKTNQPYSYSDVTPNGEALPKVFSFSLQGQYNDEKVNKKYQHNIEKGSQDENISYSARANALKRAAPPKVVNLPYSLRYQTIGHVLTPSELAVVSVDQPTPVISGRVVGTNDANKMLELRCEKTKQQLDEEWRKSDPVTYSQHSSIVANPEVPKMAMAYDLAIGQCLAFELQGGQFWNSLLWRADWRNKNNPNISAKKYYQTGILPFGVTKVFMSKADEILPTGEFGVVNQFYNSRKVIPARYPEFENKEVAQLQWDMPKPAGYGEVPYQYGEDA
ncbi:T6SS effector phospholipase Tle3 domain-containing protein [Hafnia paralvei]|uniref:T6SS effector phospholipase Tle3 domain-containing protein n=1 Tax=Hafnia paralvei TaxID=546367 RepID=UPI00241F3E35|nr:DUF3274 domain-containing protein [Hafnia paralvei]